MRINAVGCLLILLFVAFESRAEAPIMAVTYPITAETDTRLPYLKSVLRLALEKSGQPYHLKASARNMSMTRKIKSLVAGDISVLWHAANQEVEQQIRPVRIPIYGGLMGYRVFITHQRLSSALSRVRDLPALRQFRFGLGIGWDDSKILKRADFSVCETAYERLFKLVSLGRIQLYSRGIQEAKAEISVRHSQLPNLVIDPSVGLVYPKLMYMYVNPLDERLYQALLSGLKKAYADGSFARLFYQHPAVRHAIAQERETPRRWLHIDNPFLTQAHVQSAQPYLQQASFHEALSRLAPKP